MAYGDVNWPIFKTVIWVLVSAGFAYEFWLVYTGISWAYINGFSIMFMASIILFSLIGSTIIGSYNQKRRINEDPWHRLQKATSRRWGELNRNR